MSKRILIFSLIAIICLILFLVTANFIGIPIRLTEATSLLLSTIAIAISVITFSRTQKTVIMPVLVFVQKAENIWHIENVGKGPAITVKIASKNKEGKWDVVLFSPIAAGATLNISILEKDTDYGAVYTDIKGNIYSSIYTNNVNEFFEKNMFPEWKAYITEWRRKQIREELRRNF